MIKNILVPVDGSEHSGKALASAVDITEKNDSNLSVLLVVSHEIDEELQHFTTMVIMGNRGLSDIKGLLMGSASRKVSKLSNIHLCQLSEIPQRGASPFHV